MVERKRFRFDASVFAVVRRHGAILSLRRSGTGWLDGHWSVPAGAYEGRETFLDAAVRELREETGLSTDPALCRVVHMQQVFMREGEWLAVYVEVSGIHGEPRLAEPHKHDRVAWRRLGADDEPVVPYVAAALAELSRAASFSIYRTSAF